jgi:uncharacterized protein
MDLKIVKEIQQLNPWLVKKEIFYYKKDNYLPRMQQSFLLDAEWDPLWLLLVGPRRAGKTTLGFYLCHQWLQEKRFEQLIYLNCDYPGIRHFLDSPVFVDELLTTFQLTRPILFIDEVQRLETPGLLLKAINDLNLPIKMLASGSSYLEIKSKVQEHLTGRELESLVLPLSYFELDPQYPLEDQLIFGAYPQVTQASKKQTLLTQLYKRYINKDIIEILKLNKPDALEKLITLVAHSAGQLVNYQQFANDCHISVPTVQSYLTILEQTYVIAKLTPFVGNKRTEITSNPVYYFIDNGFRNQAIRNFTDLFLRADIGLLVENFIFQQLLKIKVQNFYDFEIHFWRTKANAEVDFVLYKNEDYFMPIEVKYRNLHRPTVHRGFRSFIEVYQPKIGIVITQSLIDTIQVESCCIYFIPLAQIGKLPNIIQDALAF